MYQVVPWLGGGAALKAIETATDLVWAGLPLSLTVAVKLVVPVADGIPEMMPVVAASVRPAGRLPTLIDHVYAGVPPLACSVAEYVVPSVPDGRLDVVIVKVGTVTAAAATTSVREMDLVRVGLE